MIERTVQIEAQMGGTPTLLDLLKGTDLRRTIITCLVYASQNFAGNLIANQATFFFERKYQNPYQAKNQKLTTFKKPESIPTWPSSSISSMPVSNLWQTDCLGS
jgi:hypothetical protein